MTGLMLLGKIVGLRTRSYQGKIMGYELGVEIERPNGFGGVTTEIKTVRVPEEQQPHIQNACNSLTGKLAYIQVYESAFAGRNGAISQLNYQPDTQIVEATKSDSLGEAKIKAA